MRAVAAFVLVACLAGSAHAVPRAFEATLSIIMPGSYTCISDPPPGYGSCGWPLQFDANASGVAEIDLTPAGSLVHLSLAADLFSIDSTRYVSDNFGPYLWPLNAVSAQDVANGTGSFGPSGGVMPLAGIFKYCLFGGLCPSAVGNISVPLSVVGAGGTATFIGPVNSTVIGAPWTTGTITAGAVPLQVHGGHAPGHLELVTPIYVSTNIASFAEVTYVYARLTIDYVPEPTSMVLLGLGVAAFGAMGRARR